jgi:hypothetical protein
MPYRLAQPNPVRSMISKHALDYAAIIVLPSSYCHHRAAIIVLPLLHDHCYTTIITRTATKPERLIEFEASIATGTSLALRLFCAINTISLPAKGRLFSGRLKNC